MKISDIVTQLRLALPKYTDVFSDSLAVTLTFAAGLVTATSLSAHNLSTNDYTTITDAIFPTQISSITRIGNTATATTLTDHDLTINYHKAVNITGSDQSEYNGEVTLSTVPNRRTFTFLVIGAPTTPATGSITLNENRKGYNGRHQVTKVSDLVFTYPITQSPNGASSGKSKSNIRIWGGVTYDRVLESYTKQETSKLSCFVVPQPSLVSRDNRVRNDASNNLSAGTTVQIRNIETFSVYIFSPVITTSAMNEYDAIQDISPSLYKSLIGVKLPSNLSEDRVFGISLNGDGFHAYNTVVYVHAFEFESLQDITASDIASLDESVAFRDIEMNILNSFDEIILTVKADLDDNPV